MRRAAFLDRDGTIIHDAHYLDDPQGVIVLPGAAPALRLLNQAGVLVIIVTNQSGIARGLLTEDILEAVHARMAEVLAQAGARVDDIIFCPHLPEGTVPEYTRACDCRKPEPGMILEAARRHQIDLARSVAIGDAERDLEAGRRAGCRTVFIHRPDKDRPTPAADFVAENLLSAVRWFLTIPE